MKKQINIRFLVLLCIILFVGIWRITFNGKDAGILANFTPIGAMALFGGAYFQQQWKAYLFPILTLFVSDVVMMTTYYAEYSNGLLYGGWYWTYGGFFLMVLIGKCIQKVSFKSVIISAIAAALTHWIVVDFGVWLGGGTDVTTGLPYTRDIQGLIKCYTLAIPFMKSMLMGNFIFGAILFGSFELAQRQFPVLKLSRS
ncbi:DUF6580 family putative transport protein [Sediminitomix flava]|uniref:Uncharacterized protein n=1 Tax=Sediminitomix flava TaxID=379075 RepID=A0A315ZD42_SEDFL|nr:DUF6580 family putative transport protein [Sediminitomix flava]PWJ43039.1 hypothetical protein BC781_102587 [Sediminitomix flava]